MFIETKTNLKFKASAVSVVVWRYLPSHIFHRGQSPQSKESLENGIGCLSLTHKLAGKGFMKYCSSYIHLSFCYF